MNFTDREILNASIPGPPSKDQVLKLCDPKGFDHNRLTYTTATGKIFFIKYNNATIAEAHAKLFFYSHVKANPQSTIRIPDLHHTWVSDQDSSVYLVREYIDIYHSALAHRGDYIRHPFFKYREATKIYSSVQELQGSYNWVNLLHPAP